MVRGRLRVAAGVGELGVHLGRLRGGGPGRDPRLRETGATVDRSRLARGRAGRREAGDPLELGVGGAGQLLLNGDQGEAPGLEALDGDELEEVARPVEGGAASVRERAVDQPDGRVPADGPPVRDVADASARLAVVVDGQRGVDPLGELVKRPAWFLHEHMMTVSYDSVKVW